MGESNTFAGFVGIVILALAAFVGVAYYLNQNDGSESAAPNSPSANSVQAPETLEGWSPGGQWDAKLLHFGAQGDWSEPVKVGQGSVLWLRTHGGFQTCTVSVCSDDSQAWQVPKDGFTWSAVEGEYGSVRVKATGDEPVYYALTRGYALPDNWHPPLILIRPPAGGTIQYFNVERGEPSDWIQIPHNYRWKLNSLGASYSICYHGGALDGVCDKVADEGRDPQPEVHWKATRPGGDFFRLEGGSQGAFFFVSLSR